MPVRLFSNPIVRYASAFVLTACIFAALWAPLAPARLYDFDAANFALALDYFAPAAHQPQPSGYPLYVGLTKLVHLVVPDVAITFLIAGILGSSAAVVMLWMLGEQMFGQQTGVFAALLLATNPILWQTAMSDQVRIYIAVISIGVALVLWPGWQGTLMPRRLAVAGFVLGVLTGFRPEMLVSMAPLAVAGAIRSRLKIRDYLLSAVAVAVGMAPWFLFLLVRVGGVSGFVAMLRTYSAEQAAGSSVVFGASWNAAWKMFESGFWWLSLGLVAWLPAVFLVRWRKVSVDTRGQAGFMAVWFLSLFAFSIAIHIAASGHALGFIPVACLAGGQVLSATGDSRGRLAMGACVLLALALNVYFFFKPYAMEVREASYPAVDGTASVQDAALERIDALPPGFLISDDAWVRWRILQYYYPKDSLLYLPVPLAPEGTALPVWLIRNRLRVRDLDPKSELQIPACGTIVWLISDERSRAQLLAAPGADEESRVITTPARPGMRFQVGRYRLATNPELCASVR